jgi:hypothetical protein
MGLMTGSRLPPVAGRGNDAQMDPRYPVGKFSLDSAVSADKRGAWIATIASLPRDLERLLASLPEGGLDARYRDGGWTARQVVHHLADSHMNAYFRIKLALTEDAPMLKTYEEQLWAELPDGRDADPVLSMTILSGLHRRMTLLLESLAEDQFARTARHPQWGDITVDWLLQMYAWHCRHHLAHIELALRSAVAH